MIGGSTALTGGVLSVIGLFKDNKRLSFLLVGLIVNSIVFLGLVGFVSYGILLG